MTRSNKKAKQYKIIEEIIMNMPKLKFSSVNLINIILVTNLFVFLMIMFFIFLFMIVKIDPILIFLAICTILALLIRFNHFMEMAYKQTVLEENTKQKYQQISFDRMKYDDRIIEIKIRR